MSRKTLLLLLTSLSVFSQTEKEREKISNTYNQTKLTELSRLYNEDYRLNRVQLEERAKKMNLPLFLKDENGYYAELVRFEGEVPIYYKTYNAGAAITTRANRLNSGGSLGLNLNGQDMIVGIWDGGAVRSTHQDLTGRVVQKDGAEFLEANLNTNHATHVSGTMMGSGIGGANVRGIAYQSTLWANTWGNDFAEATDQAAEGLLLSNHSYGSQADDLPAWYFGAYTNTSASWDEIMYNAPYYQVVFAAGNDRNDIGVPGKLNNYDANKGGRELITGASTAKNVLVVGAVNQVNNYTGANSVVMSNFSNWGPTDDKRIKPDICAKGVGITSTSAEGDDGYLTLDGTSMAAPGVTSSLLLLQQHYNNLNANFMKSSTLRALLIHTADEAGTANGPDFKYGWGLMNTEKAAGIITKNSNPQVANGAFIKELDLLDGSTYTLDVTASGTEPLMVTIAWTDPAGTANAGVNDEATAKLVNDLDLKLVKNGTSYFPWAMFNNNMVVQVPNSKDNVEKVEIQNPGGTYQIQINHKNALQGGNQNYSLVVSGVNSVLNENSFQKDTILYYPNPVSDKLIINLGNEVINSIVLFDMSGRLVKQDKGEFKFSHVLDLNDLYAGVYVVKVSNDRGSVNKIIVKK